MSVGPRPPAATPEQLPDSWVTLAGQRVEITASVSKSQKRLFYWHLKSPNGRIVADGGQGYSRARGAKRAAMRLHPPASA